MQSMNRWESRSRTGSVDSSNNRRKVFSFSYTLSMATFRRSDRRVIIAAIITNIPTRANACTTMLPSDVNVRMRSR